MIYESYPWKQDLKRRKNLILKYNSEEMFEDDNSSAYTIIEKAIFYSAFIIRKLIDCKGKVSDDVDSAVVNIYAIQPMKQVDMLNRWPEEDSHDWQNERKKIVLGKNVCNWLIHSYMFFLSFNDDGIIDSFYVTSDFDRNKVLYRIPLEEWIKYMELVISDYVVELDSHYDENKKDYVYIRKERIRYK